MNNLKVLRKRKGVAQKDVADYLGVTTAAYGQYELNKRAMNPDVLSKLSDYFGVSIDIILDRENLVDNVGKQIEIQPELDAEDEVLIPVVASLRCGFGRTGEPIFREKKPVPKSYVKRWGTNIVYYEAVGESMMPTITPGDLLITVPGNAWEDGWIVVVDVNDSDTVKRIFRADDGGVNLVPDNVNKYQTMHISPKDLKTYNVTVLGHVVKAISPDL